MEGREPAVARPIVVTAADMVAGHVRLDISCLDRLHLDGYVARLQRQHRPRQGPRRAAASMPAGRSIPSTGPACPRHASSARYPPLPQPTSATLSLPFTAT